MPSSKSVRKERNKKQANEYHKYCLNNPEVEVICKNCKVEKKLKEFITSFSYKNLCKECHRKNVKSWRKLNPKKPSAIRRKQYKRASDYISSTKEGRPCSICNEVFPPCAMDYHHIGNKIDTVSRSHFKSRKKLDEEIAKCELVCANCHRNETQAEFFCEGPKITGGEGTVKAYVISLKDNASCKDCLRTFRYWQLDFDHIGNSKFMGISQMNRMSIETVKKEIAKCELICANCHRIRSKKTRDSMKECSCGFRPRSASEFSKHQEACTAVSE